MAAVGNAALAQPTLAQTSGPVFYVYGEGPTTPLDSQVASAADAAKAAGGSVCIVGVVAYSDVLSFDSCGVFGAGPGSQLHAVNPAASQVVLYGTGPWVQDLVVTCPSATARDNKYLAAGIVVDAASDFFLKNVIVDRVANAGFVTLEGAVRGRFTSCIVRNSLSDGFHNTNEVAEILFESCLAYSTGDDSFSVVGYTSDAVPVKWVTFADCYSFGSQADGFRVSGGEHVRIKGGGVYNAAVRAAVLAADGSAGTYGNLDVVVDSLTVDTPSTNGSYGGLYIGGYDAAHLAEQTVIANVSVYNQQSPANGAVEIGPYARNTLVHQLAVADSSGAGVYIGVGALGAGAAPQDVMVRDGNFSSVATYGVYADNCTGALAIERNVFRAVDTGSTAIDVVRITANCTAELIRLGENVHVGPADVALTHFINNLSSQPTTTDGNYSATRPSVYGSVLAGHELDFAKITSNLSVTATSVSRAQTVVAGSSRMYDGDPIMIEFWCVGLDRGGNYIGLELYDGSTDICFLGGSETLSNTVGRPVKIELPFTPTPGRHQFIVKAWVNGGIGTVYAGRGAAAGQNPPAFLRVTRRYE